MCSDEDGYTVRNVTWARNNEFEQEKPVSEVQNQQQGGQQQTQDAAGQATDQVGQAVEGVQDTVGGLTGDQEQGSEGALGGVIDQTQGAAGQVIGQAQDVAGQATDRAGREVGQAHDGVRAGQVGHQVLHGRRQRQLRAAALVGGCVDEVEVRTAARLPGRRWNRRRGRRRDHPAQRRVAPVTGQRGEEAVHERLAADGEPHHPQRGGGAPEEGRGDRGTEQEQEHEHRRSGQSAGGGEVGDHTRTHRHRGQEQGARPSQRAACRPVHVCQNLMAGNGAGPFPPG